MIGEFPKPVNPPRKVIVQRHQRLRQLVRSCLQGIGIRTAIILAELIGVWFFGSAALLMDALSSTIDVAMSVLLVIFLKIAARPPDDEHPFGHGRLEPLVGLQLGLLMIFIGGGMFFHQTFSLSSPGEAIDKRAWIIPLAAVILLEICYHVVMRASKNQKSSALVAEAYHYRVDAITSVCAAIVLLAGAYFPAISHSLDHIGAMAIALVMIGLGIKSLRENLDQIIDRIPDESYFERIRAAAIRVEGVRGTEKIGIQHSGPSAHVDIDVEVDPDLSVEVAHAISQKVRVEIQKDWPAVQDVIVHIEPYYPGDH